MHFLTRSSYFQLTDHDSVMTLPESYNQFLKRNESIWKCTWDVMQLLQEFERSVYRNKHETKRENKDTTKEYRYFLNSKFVGANRLFVLVYSDADDYAKRLKAERFYLPRGIIKNYNAIIN